MKGAIKMRMQVLKGRLNTKTIAANAYRVFYANTPVKTGNARRNTKLVGSSIEAKYPYAVRLDRGWSKQSPKGMTIPTIRFIREYIKRQLGR